MEITGLLEFGSRSEWRSWLQNHHATESSCWLAIYRSKQPPRGVCLQYVDAVEEALCFGWIDSTLKSRHAQCCTARKSMQLIKSIKFLKCLKLLKSFMINKL